ncbi:MAG: protein arginine kinase [Firmicutes bacterium]|nr:protein arginine kinase [Bacillota bacterium]
MFLGDTLDKNLSSWMKKEGPEGDIVLGTRVRLARNFAKIPFPGVANKEQAKKVLDNCTKLDEVLSGLGKFTFYKMAEVDSLERQLLVEKHLISPAHTEATAYKGLLLSESEDISIMINEEDHLRIQVLYPGFQIEEAWRLADRIDDLIEAKQEYAFDNALGYLTSCPTNVGTGMRASVMVHLPALAKLNQLSQVLNSVTQFGLVVRGLYGEGSESYGNIFQISNQVSLGHTEEDIVELLAKITAQIIASERQARQFLIQSEQRLASEDSVCRSYGILAHARKIGTKEAMELLSNVRLGIDLGILKNLDKKILKELMVCIRAAHLQKIMGQSLPPEERDRLRASLIRERLQSASA